MKRSLVLAAASLAAWSCGAPSQPDTVVALTIASPSQMPFHGPHGPGTEPMYIAFNWTVVLTASGGGNDDVGMVRTRLVDSLSGTVLNTENGPLGSLAGRGRLELPQQAGRFFPSSLYPGDWSGTTTAEILHRDGRSETLTATFSFR